MPIPIVLMTPRESSDGGGLGALAGSRPSSEIDAYGGTSDRSPGLMHPAAITIAPPASRPRESISGLLITASFFVPAITVSARERGFNARASRVSNLRQIGFIAREHLRCYVIVRKVIGESVPGNPYEKNRVGIERTERNRDRTFMMVAVLGLLASATARADDRVGAVTQVRGIAQIQRGGVSIPAQAGTPVKLHDTVMTQPDSSARLGFRRQFDRAQRPPASRSRMPAR